MHHVLEKLKVQLEQQEWPDVYMFKFIVPNQSEKVAQVNALFNNSTDIVMHPSKTGKYISVTAKELMLDVDSILAKYEEAALIEGLIAL
jgi:putative lipoic acid-binding regulatory protein